MRTAFVFVTFALLGCAIMPIDAQIVPAGQAKPAAIADSAMVFEDRGQQLEIYPALRATPALKPGTPVVEHRLSSAGESTPIGPRSLAVIFNHALQARGYLTGEITFKPKREGLPTGLDAANYPGLAKIVEPNIYVVLAASPKEFIGLLNRLKAHADLEWVEPVVVYGTAANQTPPERSPRLDSKAPR